MEEMNSVHSVKPPAYTTGMTAGLKATFAVQNAVLAAGTSLLETATLSNRDLAKQFIEAAHQAQEAALEAWQASFRAAGKLAANDEKA
jgi:hypothetical protein